MAPKKGKGKKDDENRGVFNEVERKLMELELADCNRKLANIRSAAEEYEIRIEELQRAYKKLDEDRADVITYLKRMLAVKTDENSELKERAKGLEEIREIENAQFNETTHRLEKEFIFMKAELTSHNKLLTGKLNMLEEFRAIREDLMEKFETQEVEFKDQEMKYKRLLYDNEKKFVISKDNLKKEMESKLLQLALDFQDVTQLRVAASTHRVIRENIAMNNEMENMLSTQERLAEQNEILKEKMREALVAQELAKEERDTAINRSILQLKVIERLTAEFESIKKEKALRERRVYDYELLHERIKRLTKENDNFRFQVRVLEQNLHARISDQNKTVVEMAKVSNERDKLKTILKEATCAIQAASKMDKWASTHGSKEDINKQVMLSQLLEIVLQFRNIEDKESVCTISSFNTMYDKGDLGIVPKTPVVATVTKSAARNSRDHVSRSEARSPSNESLSRSTVQSSINTVPSLKVLPPTFNNESFVKHSIESFVASVQSEEIEDEEKIIEDDIETILATSKAEMQKSLMKDLMASQIPFALSQMSVDNLQTKSQTQVKHQSGEDIIKDIDVKDIDVQEPEQEKEKVDNDEYNQDDNVDEDNNDANDKDIHGVDGYSDGQKEEDVSRELSDIVSERAKDEQRDDML
ncbi:cilia- and flagella-associated protein 157-like [Helicoverpa zea]|uniref:cilia- and flagella-associated protein 157-like n=1 Tax=Helicoverpa zea TaxID=7113 RepID=UPI001F58C9D7|nr:cilia- and flagella-associated protein 157-like [Helicoverpa zea]